MASKLTTLGIRHHGPGSARMVVRALTQLRPDAVLIEGPPDAAEVLSLAGHEDMKPPVALLVYEPDEPSESSYYPFATFSPEWQAIRWSIDNSKEVRFIDLPQSLRPRSSDRSVDRGPSNDEPKDDSPNAGMEAHPKSDVLGALARAAGFSDGETWWGRLIEEHRGNDDPLGLFDAIRKAMATAREHIGASQHDNEEAAREAHMRKSIRAAIKQGFENIAVVCGAWHAPVLTVDALKDTNVKADDDTLKGLTKRKTAATWIPWTYDRLSTLSGYGAGIASPGWYEHLWVHHDRLTESWMTKVARLMRDEDLDASPASVIESVRLAGSLAALRGRSVAGLDELDEATLSILCHGNPLPMRIIHSKLIVGNRLGEVPDASPTVPLQRDLAALQKSLRIKVSADSSILDLDQRKDTDLARSHLLHRLALLNIHWGELQVDQMQRTSTFHEIWRLQWKPEFAVNVMEAARWGNTVHEAAGAFAVEKARSAGSLRQLTVLLDHVILASLPLAVERLLERVQALSAVASDIGHLLEAVSPLARVMRYGSVRKTDSSLLEPIIAGLLARICVGLAPACGSLDDDAASIMRQRINTVHAALSTLDRADFSGSWMHELRKLGDADIHGLVAGQAWRHLLDSGTATSDDAATRFSLALSPGNDPQRASAWLEGFLGGSGIVLIHDERLLAVVDEWVCSLPRGTFEQVCPIARRTFATFEKPERRQIGEKLARAMPTRAQTTSAARDDYDPVRGALVEPVLRLILGDHL